MLSHGGCKGHYGSSVMLVAVVIVHSESTLYLMESTQVCRSGEQCGFETNCL